MADFDFMKILQQRMDGLQPAQQGNKSFGDLDRQDWSKILMSFGQGAAGANNFGEVLSGGGAGVANMVRGLQQKNESNDGELFQLQKMMHDAQMGQTRSTREEERYQQRMANERKSAELSANQRIEDQQREDKYRMDKMKGDTDRSNDKEREGMAKLMLERGEANSVQEAYTKVDEILMGRSGGNVKQLISRLSRSGVAPQRQ